MASKPYPRIYRATAEAWIGRFMLPFTFLFLLIVTVLNTFRLDPIVASMLLLLVIVWGLFEFLLPMLRNWIRVDEHALEGSLNGQRFTIDWVDILAAWTIDRNRRKFLCLGTHEGTAIIPLRFLDERAVWLEVQGRVSPAALEPGAMQRLPDYQDWVDTRDTLVSEGDVSYRVVDHWFMQAFGWGSLAFWLASTKQAWVNGQYFLIFLYILLAGVALAFVLSWGITEFDNEGITRRTILGVWHIRWEELRWIELDLAGSTLVFTGEDRQMVTYGPALWSGPGRRDVLSILHAQAEHRRIELRRSWWAFLRFSRNTRVKKK